MHGCEHLHTHNSFLLPRWRSNCSVGPRIPVRAGHLFVGTEKLASNQVVLIKEERITEVGPAEKMRVPAAAVVIGLSRATVLPGLIDAHTHVFGNSSDFETQRRTGRRRVDLIRKHNHVAPTLYCYQLDREHGLEKCGGHNMRSLYRWN